MRLRGSMMKYGKHFLISLGMFLLLLVIFVSGAVVDRLFVFRPLDYLFPRPGLGGLNRTLTQTVLNEESAVIDVTEKAAPSVVTVSIKEERRITNPFFIDPFDLFGRQSGDQSQTQTIEQDIGTGFVVEGGLVVTNKHVVSIADAEYKVVDRDGNEHAITNVYRDPSNDLAILQVDGDALNPIELGDSNELKVGQSVVAIGTALGEFRHTVTTGVISGLGRGIEGSGLGGYVERIDNVIQTDAAINPGNSGGPLLNSAGQVIGINTAISSGAENIGFAIPINVLKESLDNFEETGRFDRAFLGVSYQLIPKETAILNDVPSGAFIRRVVEGSAASKAGLVEGDIITKMNGQSLDEENTLAEIISRSRIGDTIDIDYWRDGETTSVRVTLEAAEL